jgi:hypothetical protein
MAAQDVKITNLPNAGSAEAVALELWKLLYSASSTEEEKLRLYVRCLDATRQGGAYWHKEFR